MRHNLKTILCSKKRLFTNKIKYQNDIDKLFINKIYMFEQKKI